MAEIRDELVLDIDQALRDITRVEQALDRSLAPVELRIDVDDTAVQRVEDSLRDVRTVAEDTTSQVRLTADEYREVARAIETGVTPARAIAEATGQIETRASLAEADFRDLARALDISEDEAARLTREILESQQAAKRLEDSARDVARQLGLSDREAERLAGSLREADRAADNINTRGTTLVGTFGSLRGAAAGIAGSLAAIGGTALLVGAISGANTAIQSFARLEDSINAVNVIFGEAGASVLTFGEDAAKSAGLSQEAFNQAVVPIGALLQNFGFDAKEAADAAVILVQRGADLASVYGGTVQDALLAVGAALRGEADPLERYGASISAARVETFALNEQLIRTKAEITPAITLQARYGLILADTAAVSGDFANTSGDLANAQRSAAGEVQNFAAEIGEALAPAMEALVAVLPEVLEGVRQLVPTFAAGADSAADFFQSINEGAGGFRTPVANLSGGVGLLNDVFLGLGDVGSALFDTFTFEFDKAGQQVDQFGGRIANTSRRIGAIGLARDLDAGVDSALAFANALAFVARDSDSLRVFEDSFRGFAIAAGLSKDELYEVTLGLYNNATQLGLTADEVDFLRSQLDLLNETLDTGSRRGYTDYNAAVDGLGASLPEAAARFVTFSGELATARTTITQTLQGIADDAAGQQDRLLDALDPFAELPEQIELSAKEATAALVAQFEAIAAFEADIIRLAADAPNLALELFQKGPAAADLVEDFLDTPALIEEAENALRGVATAGVNALTEELENDLVKAGLDPSTAAQFAALFTNSNVITEITDAGIRAGATGAGGYIQGVLDEAAAREVDARTTLGQTVSAVFDQEEITDAAGESASASFLEGAVGFDPLGQLETILGGLGIEVDLTDSGANALSSFLGGFTRSAEAQAGAFGKAVEDAVNRGLIADSPSKLMIAIGQAAAEAFGMGFEQANLSLRSPVPAITGSISGTSTTATNVVEGGFTFAPTVINPTVQDLETTLARQGQLFGAVSGALGRVGRALPK